MDEVEEIIKADPLCGSTEVLKVVADVSNENDVRRLFDAAGDVEGKYCRVRRSRFTSARWVRLMSSPA